MGKWLKLEQSNFLISTDELILSKISRSYEKVDFCVFYRKLCVIQSRKETSRRRQISMIVLRSCEREGEMRGEREVHTAAMGGKMKDIEPYQIIKQWLKKDQSMA